MGGGEWKLRVCGGVKSNLRAVELVGGALVWGFEGPIGPAERQGGN